MKWKYMQMGRRKRLYGVMWKGGETCKGKKITRRRLSGRGSMKGDEQEDRKTQKEK